MLFRVNRFDRGNIVWKCNKETLARSLIFDCNLFGETVVSEIVIFDNLTVADINSSS